MTVRLNTRITTTAIPMRKTVEELYPSRSSNSQVPDDL